MSGPKSGWFNTLNALHALHKHSTLIKQTSAHSIEVSTHKAGRWYDYPYALLWTAIVREMHRAVKWNDAQNVQTCWLTLFLTLCVPEHPKQFVPHFRRTICTLPCSSTVISRNGNKTAAETLSQYSESRVLKTEESFVFWSHYHAVTREFCGNPI